MGNGLKGLASFAAGFGGGYLNAKRQGMLDEERQADRAMRQQEFDARMGEVNDKKNLRMSLADAARPVTVESGAGGAIRPETMDNRDVGLAENASQPNAGLSLSQYRVKDKSYETQELADTAAAAQNTRDARRMRQADVYDAAGRPAEATSLENSALSQKQNQIKFNQDQNTYAAKVKSEGLLATAQMARTGNGKGVFDTFNKQGDIKLDAVPKVTLVERNLPGYGLIKSYDYEGSVTGADGVSAPFKKNSHDMSMELMDYEKALGLGIKGNDSVVKQQKMLGDINNATEKNRLTGEANVAKVEAAAAKAAAAAATAGGKPLNDTQSKALLFGTRMREADLILSKLAAEGTTTSIPGSRGAMGGAINAMSSANKQMLDQAKRDFVNAVLRRESGAVIADTEFANAEKQYFAQIGDDPKTIQQKANNRKLALDGILLEVPEKQRNSLQPRSADITPLAMPKTIADMKPGSVYQTGRGPAKWNGTAFEAQ